MLENLPPLNNDTIWQIIDEKLDNDLVNKLVWYYLGYRYDSVNQTWDISQLEESWKQEYPSPPDFIANRPPNVKLTRSILPENKQLLKEELGFKGYKIGEFGPPQTRRATIANWLLGYRKIHNLEC
ncbi:DUF1823 family protein [Geminocystis sp.]|uniref:DUF1823 family protein n=1 Tax=Geminocystis sp. TaxID=2664100 RepID=UPI003592EA57